MAAGTLSTATPVVTGTPAVGEVLSANPGTWGPSVVALSYQWKAGATNITGATGSTLLVPASALGQPITVSVTGTRNAYTTATTTSAPTANMALGTLTAPTPTITGTAAVGGTLTAVPGPWRPYPVTMSYQWSIAGVPFAGATAQTFVIPGSAAGKTITVTATGTKTAYSSVSKTSAPVGPVTGGGLSGPIPTITGTAQVGATLTANPGTWTPAPVTLAIQWKSNGATIAGATSATLVVPAASLGQTITVTVTGTKTGYTTLTTTSATTSPVSPGVLTAPAPGISGTAQVGSTLTVNTGAWGPDPVALTYQWKSAGTNISGATGTSLVIPAASLGQTITVTVTGTKTGYTTATQTSPPTAAVTDTPPGTLTTAVPTITGTAQVGSTLTANPGTWGPAPVTLAYQWKSAGTDIAGATGSTLAVPAASLGQTITVTVTGTKTGYTTASQTSTATAAVAAGTLTAPTPTITGTAVVDGTLTAGPGAWAPAPVALTYQWKANGTTISGATDPTFTPTPTQLGQTISVTVTGTKTGYTTASQTSTATAAVVAGTLTAPTPTITGTAVVGGTLTAVPGTWAPAPVALTYQWKANGTSITGATTSTLALTASQLGQTVTVTVTGTKTGYTTAAKDSTATPAVAGATLTTAVPTITGTAVVDGTLTAVPGTWGPAPVTLAYQWKANGSTISGATATTLTIPATALGQTITVSVTGSKAGYATETTDSLPTASVVAAVLTAPTPTITGTPTVDATLTAVPGTWGPSPVTLTYQWKSGGSNITGATGSTLVVPAASVGQTITVTVTGTKTGYTTTSKTSTATAAVAPGTLTAPTPTISGTAQEGATLTAAAGVWTPAPVVLTYQWKSGGTNITGATGTTLVVPAASVGQTITVTVTGTKTGYTTTSQTSAPTAVVTGAPPGTLTTAIPTITGTAQVDATLTADPGTWGPAPGGLDLPVEVGR